MSGSGEYILFGDTVELPLPVADANPMAFSGFGDQVTLPLVPLYQADWAADTAVNGRLYTTTVSGGAAAALASSKLSLSGPAASSGAVEGPLVKYRPGYSMMCRYTTVFPSSATDAGAAYVGLASATNGVLVGVDAGTPTIIWRKGGSDTAIAQGSWNGDAAAIAAIDFTKGNIWQWNVPYLGFGSLRLYVMGADNAWKLVHTIERPNSDPDTTFTVPSFRFRLETAGEAHAQSASVMVGIHGFDRVNRQLLWAGSVETGTIGSAAESFVYALRNASTEDALIRLADFSIGIDTTKPSILRLYVGTSTGGTFAAVDADSIAEQTGAGTRPTGLGAGTHVVFSRALPQAGGVADISLREFSIDLEPGQELIASVLHPDRSIQCDVAAVWWDDV